MPKGWNFAYIIKQLQMLITDIDNYSQLPLNLRCSFVVVTHDRLRLQ